MDHLKKELYRVLEDGAMFIGCMCLESEKTEP